MQVARYLSGRYSASGEHKREFKRNAWVIVEDYHRHSGNSQGITLLSKCSDMSAVHPGFHKVTLNSKRLLVRDAIHWKQCEVQEIQSPLTVFNDMLILISCFDLQ